MNTIYIIDSLASPTTCTVPCSKDVNKIRFLCTPKPSCLLTNLPSPFLSSPLIPPSVPPQPSSAAHFCTEGMAAAVSIIHFPSEQVVFALQGAAGENREGEEERLKTWKNEEWSWNGWRLWIQRKNESVKKKCSWGKSLLWVIMMWKKTKNKTKKNKPSESA